MQFSWMNLWEKAAGLSWLRSLQSAFIITFPLMFAGSLAVLVNQFPLPVYRHTMANLFGPNWTELGGHIWNGTFAIMSAAVVFAVGMNLAIHCNNKQRTRQVSPITVGLVSFSSLFCLIVPINGGIPQEWTGVAGLFGAVMVALTASTIFLALSSIRLLRMRLSVDNADGSVVQAFSSLLPGSITIGIFGVVGLLFGMKAGTGFHSVLYSILTVSFESFDSAFMRGLFYTFSLQFLWFFGIHGANVLDPVTHGINVAAIEENIRAAATGEILPNIITKPFLDSFVFIGGTGCTISLILALLIASRFSERRRLAGISSVFGIFNINELLVFGFPIILNPVVLIPFIFTPVILCAVAYGVVSIGLVPKTSASVGWSVPIFVNAYMVTGSVKGVLLQLFNIALATCLYIPFVRLADSIRSKELLTAISRLFDCVNGLSPVERQQRCLNREGTLGALARGLATDLEDALKKKQQSGLYLLYQPQVSPLDGKVVGVEALLRWNHPKVGHISPLVTIALAEDADLIEPLGEWIINESCRTRKHWLDTGIRDVSMSFNISVHQITNKLPKIIAANMQRYSIPPHLLKTEVTESVSLDAAIDGPLILECIHEAGVKIAIDDFGMGHSSLIYLRKFPVSSVKIDGSITREIGTSTLSADIVSSIVGLCRSRDIECVVEYVETEEQMHTLMDLGCQVFQGYYFSPPLAEAACAEYIRSFSMHEKR